MHLNLKGFLSTAAVLATLAGGFEFVSPKVAAANPAVVQPTELVAQIVYSEVYIKNDTGRAIYAYAANSVGTAKKLIPAYSTVRMGRTSKRYITVWAIGADYDDTRSWVKRRVDTGNGSEPYTHTFYDSSNTY